MTCRCCPICALQTHSHQNRMCVQHPHRSWLSGLSLLLGKAKLELEPVSLSSSRCIVTQLVIVRTARRLHRVLLGSSELLRGGVRERANVLCSQFSCDCHHSGQRGVAGHGGVVQRSRKQFAFAHLLISYRTFRFRPRNVASQSCQSSCGSATVCFFYLNSSPFPSDPLLSSFLRFLAGTHNRV